MSNRSLLILTAPEQVPFFIDKGGGLSHSFVIFIVLLKNYPYERKNQRT